MEAACELYGTEAVVAARLMDVEGVLPAEARASMEGTLDAFEMRFPQLFLLMYLGPLPAPVSPRQFAFWLLNHAAVPELDAMRPNERGLLLLVDPQGGTAVLTGGYFLENFITQEELDAVLRPAVRDLGRREYPAALAMVSDGLGSLLKKRAKEAARHPQRFFAPPPEPPPGEFPPLMRTGEVMPATGAPEGPEAASELPSPNASESEAPPANAAPPSKEKTPRGQNLKAAARRLKPRRR